MVAVTAAGGILGYQLAESSSAPSRASRPATSASAVEEGPAQTTPRPQTVTEAATPHSTEARPTRPASPPRDASRPIGRGALDLAGGAVPDGTTPFDDWVPGIARLDPDLLQALRRAASAAGASGVEILVESGWRSPAYQERLLREAVARYGSEEEAARWVATPERSAHVSGDAVDVEPEAAAAWLAEHGAAYGLCRVYDNEPWHFELRTQAVTAGCPPTYADPTHDPRMHADPAAG